MNNIPIKTKYQLDKEKLDNEIYSEYHKLISQDGAMATAVDKHLMEKYSIHSKSTIWFIRKRVEKRMEKLIKR